MSERQILIASRLRVDITDERAWLGEEQLSLSQKPFLLLVTLMRSPQLLLTKDALIEAVWEGRAVSDAVLTTAIKELRQALGDSAKSSEFVGTVHAKGYRFLQPVKEVTSDVSPGLADLGSTPTHQASSSESIPPTSAKASRSGAVTNQPINLLIGVAALIAVVFVWMAMSNRAGPDDTAPIEPTSIAVLAFEDLSIDGDQSYFSDGVSEEILNSLVKLDNLYVAGRTSSFSFRGQQTDIQSIGAALNVAHVLEGSVRTNGNRVRITAQLIEVENGYHLWSEVYERETDDIFAIQDEIARSVAEELKVILVGTDDDRLIQAPTTDQEAYRLYLQANALLARRVGNNIPRAIELYQDALIRDPEFARAWSALASAYAIQPDYDYDIDLERAADEARGAAEKAIALDPNLAEPYAVLGLIEFDHRNYVAARKAFERANELDPNDINVMFWHATLLRSVGDMTAAARISERAMRADPISPLGYVSKATFAFATGDLETATRLAERARDLGHPTGNYILAKIAERTGDAVRAQALHLESFNESGVSTWFAPDDVSTLIQGTYGAEQDRQTALALVDRYVEDPRQKRDILAPNILLDMGMIEEALHLFENSQTSLDQFFLLPVWGPGGGPVRQHAYFGEFVEGVGLIDYWSVYGWPDVCAQNLSGLIECS
ncbi:MAG: winged helix-turn-helix domain-containing protein [Hyphomonas sp.]|nr:winged helix-turn-helix domain-containing protein [Hyphomonas sp.]